MMLKLLFVFMLSLLLVAPAAFGSKQAPKSTLPRGNALVVSSFFGQKFSPAVQFPAGCEIRQISYRDYSEKPDGVVNVLYTVTSRDSFDHVVGFYRARYARAHASLDTGPPRVWDMFISRGHSILLLFTVTDTRVAKTSVPGSADFKTLIVCTVDLPPDTVEKYKSANNGWSVIPIPQ